MALLVAVVLGDVVEVVSPDNEGPVHFGGDDGTGQDTAADGDETSERAFLVCWITPYQLAIPSLPPKSFHSRSNNVEDHRVVTPEGRLARRCSL
jgi:hypothetical protein